MKKILALLLAIILCLGLCGCNTHITDIEANVKNLESEYFQPEVVEVTNHGYIIRDRLTNVLYLVVAGNNAGVMSPIYNSDGTVKLYEGE